MKITANEEYGLRLMLAIAKLSKQKSLNEESHTLVTLNDISQEEGITTDYSASILMKLREAKLVESIRGKYGGYKLTKEPQEISLFEIMHGISDGTFSPDFCKSHSGVMEFCKHSESCAIRPVWTTVAAVVDQVFHKISLADLMKGESSVSGQLNAEYGLNSQSILEMSGSSQEELIKS